MVGLTLGFQVMVAVNQKKSNLGRLVAITPVKHTIKKDDGKKKTYEPTLLPPCGIFVELEASLQKSEEATQMYAPRELTTCPKKTGHLSRKTRRSRRARARARSLLTLTSSEEGKEIKKSAARLPRFLRSGLLQAGVSA